MTAFDRFIMVDWSARAAPSPATPAADAIWIAIAGYGDDIVSYHRTRHAATAYLTEVLREECAAGRRCLVGFDFPFGYPKGFARAVTGSDDPFALWGELAARIKDGTDNANDRFDVAEELNGLFDSAGPFWGCPKGRASAGLDSRKSIDYSQFPFAERRRIETVIAKAQPVWKLYTTGSVGSQTLLGIPQLVQLQKEFGADLSVRPFETADTPIVLAEVYPSLIGAEIGAQQEEDEILDAAQVRVLAKAMSYLDPVRLAAMLAEGDLEEGWILGAGHEAELTRAARGEPPLLPPVFKDDCFALPPGIAWTPVSEAQERLRQALHVVAGPQTVPLSHALGRVTAADAVAKASNPGAANAAVDGYGFSSEAIGDGPQLLPLVCGRAVAGQPFKGSVPKGHAISILTGATVPAGVDTVVLQEDCSVEPDAIAFHGPVKPGANRRRAGEDFHAGQTILGAGHVIRPADLALLSAAGLAEISVYRRLKVAILSTGDELVDPGQEPGEGQIFDANRPMLAGLLRAWGHEVLDLGRKPDDEGAIRDALDRGAEVDAILTSGGASAGDEDHISRILSTEGNLSSWRIAIKPGRPLALALWKGKPVFGLPGNPVAAMVCALLFARPALSLMSGAGWTQPMRMKCPAGFSKSKRHGRAEYPRARLGADGRVELFKSEGSGRISGLSWAEGLVELPFEAQEIEEGDLVTFLPYAGFGL